METPDRHQKPTSNPSTDLPAIAEPSKGQRWVIYRFANKIPRQSNGQAAKTYDSATWSPFLECAKAARACFRSDSDRYPRVLESKGVHERVRLSPQERTP